MVLVGTRKWDNNNKKKLFTNKIKLHTKDINAHSEVPVRMLL